MLRSQKFMAENKDLKSKAIKGSLWSLMETFSMQLVQFFVSIVLARILDPRDYGLIAITTIFTSISAAITDGGFEKTIIRQKDISETQVSTIFYINLGLGLLMTLLISAFAPIIAAFFKDDALIPLLRVVSISITLTALGQIQQILLMKELQFKKISFAKISASWISGISGVLFAMNGFGVWSLVYSALSYQIVMLLFYWIRASWYPRLIFSYSSVKPVIPYGLNVLFSSIFYFIIQQFNNFVVGRSYSKEQLGLFNRGNRFPELISSVIQKVVLRMSMPVFSKLQDDPVQLSNAVKKSSKIVAFVSFPLLFFMLVKAEDITVFLFTAKWKGSVIFMYFFCIIKLFEPFIAMQRELILTKGNSRLLLRIFIFTSLFEIALTLSLIRFGILYVTFSTIIARVVQLVTYTTFNPANRGWRSLADYKWAGPYLLMTLAMVLIVVGMEIGLHFLHLSLPLVIKLGLEFCLGIGVYLLLAYKLKVEELDLINHVKGMLLRKKG